MNEELYNAIWGNSLEDIKLHALNCQNINSKYINGETALMSAVSRGLPEIITTLLELPGIELEVKNKYKQTALFLAAKEGEINSCKLLLDAGAKINSKDYTGGNVLLAAISKKQCFKFLLSYKPDIHCSNLLNLTPLMYLYSNKDLNSIKYLVSFSKNLDDIKYFNEQRCKIYNISFEKLKNKSEKLILENQEVNENVKQFINNAQLNIELNSSLCLVFKKEHKIKI